MATNHDLHKRNRGSTVFSKSFVFVLFARKRRYTYFALFRFHNAPVTSNYTTVLTSNFLFVATCINYSLRQFSHKLMLSFTLIRHCNQAFLLCTKLREAQSKVMARSPSCHFYVRNVKFWVDEGGGKGKCLNPSSYAEARQFINIIAIR